MGAGSIRRRGAWLLGIAAVVMAGCGGGSGNSGNGTAGKPDSYGGTPGGLVTALTAFMAGDGQSLLPDRKGGQYFTPIKPATDEMIARLKAPAGFKVDAWAKGLGNPRMMAVGPDGAIYVTRPATGEVIALRDADGNGTADKPQTVVRLPGVHGIYIHEGTKMYLATVGEAFVCDIEAGKVGKPHKIVEKMPTASGHHNRTLAIGPDGRLYITVGSTCNCCWEKNPENATMLVAAADGSDRRVFARGLRNTIGFGWHPQTRQLWGMDHGIDWLGADEPPEELNHIEEGKHYGWPFVYGDRKTIPIERHEAVGSLKEFAGTTQPPALALQAHSSPLAMVFYTGGQLGDEYRNDAFLALHGSWNRASPVGYKVVRIRFKDGKPAGYEDFLSGFLVTDGDRPYTFGRPAGLAVMKDGSLLVGDDENGVIYRISRRPNDPSVP